MNEYQAFAFGLFCGIVLTLVQIIPISWFKRRTTPKSASGRSRKRSKVST